MEYHSVPLEERSRDSKGNLLPFGHVYKDESRNPRRPPEETGSFGKRRNSRYNSTRSGTRTGTPARRENLNVAEFGRLFALQQEEEQARNKLLPSATTSSVVENSRKSADAVATECIFYGYKDRTCEWKVIDRFVRISQGSIYEDYPRTDPDIAPKYPQLLSADDLMVHKNLSADANRKSKKYAGGRHWIKVTFDSFSAADRACHFSPQVIDGYSVRCELYHGHGPKEDVPLLHASFESGRKKQMKAVLVGNSGVDNTEKTEEFDQINDFRPFNPTSKFDKLINDDVTSQISSVTASSATVTALPPVDTTLRSRAPQNSKSEFMTHIPTVRRAILRPASEALPPQPSLGERIIRSIPILSWFSGDIVGDGPVLKDDGTFDHDKSNLYWRFWYMVDKILRTDLCGLKEDS
ncbi:hypothetical protein LOZ65_001977 [Ophidiomyces ophidiicola]|nr:hypothetical protein LOZ65_001977 [Ophidiomyces ophidiicola]